MTSAGAVVFLPFGLVFGSFLTVLVYRTPRNESVVSGRSACPQCGEVIRAAQNVPVASYIALRGRCRYCGLHIPVEYPAIEVATALLFVGVALQAPTQAAAILLAPFVAVLLACGIIDARHRIIPNRIVYPSLICFTFLIVGMDVTGFPVSMGSALLGLLGYGGTLVIIAIVMPRRMGMGDARVAA